MHRTAPAAAALSLGLALVLGGCFANPLEQLAEGLIEGGVEQIIQDQTGLEVDISGGGASLPDSWPSEIATPSGQILFSASSSDLYSVSISVANGAAAEAGYQDLLANGFTELSAFDVGDGIKSYVAANDDWTVSYGFGPSDDGTVTVQITATPSTN